MPAQMIWPLVGIRHPSNSSWERMTDHHLTPRAVGGTEKKKDCNGIRICEAQHCAWHQLFDLRTLQEIIDLLSRDKYHKQGFLITPERLPYWEMLFGKIGRKKAIFTLCQIKILAEEIEATNMTPA